MTLEGLEERSLLDATVLSSSLSSPSPAAQTSIYNIDFSNGFNGNALTLNGAAAYQGSLLQLINGSSARQAGSAFYTVTDPVSQLQTDFSFQAGKAASGGLAFVLQTSSPAALGSSAGDGWQGLGNSVVVDFNAAANTATLYVNGTALGSSSSLTPGGLNLASGDVFDVHILASGTSLTVQETDEKTQAATTQTYQSVSLSNLLGSSQAYMGFTAGSGSGAQTVNITRWSYEPINAPAPLGINLGTPGYDSINLFANLAQVGTWQNANGQAAAVDANGWPTSDAILSFKSGSPFPAGTYTLAFQGQAQQIHVYGGGAGSMATSAMSYDAATDTTTLTFNAPTALSSLAVSFTGTQRDPGDPAANGGTGITNVKLMLPLYPGATSSYSPDTLFTSQAVNFLSQFSTIRYMDYSATNWNPQASWSERVLPGYATQVVTGPLDGWQGQGMSWEDAVALANATQTNMYINIPTNASDDYITRLAELIRYGSDGVNPYTQAVANPVYAPLNPNLQVYIEYSNEVWNTTFGQNQDVSNIAQVAAGEPGTPLSTPGTTSLTAEKQYALRVVQISNLFRQVFGDSEMSSRIRPLAEWQSGGGWAGQENILSFINNYFDNGNGQQNVVNPHPVNYYLWGGGAGWYSSFNNTSGTGEVNLADPNFSQLAVTQDTADPTGTPWTYGGTAGIAVAGGGLGAPTPSSGTQSAYIQGAGTLTETFTTSYDGPAALAINLAQSSGATEGVDVYIDGTEIPLSALSAGWTATGSTFSEVDSTVAFALTPGSHTIELVGTGGAGTVFLSNIRIETVDPLLLSGTSSISTVASDVQLAQAYGLQDVGYEGHLVANAASFATNNALFTAAAMDPRTAQLEENLINAFYQQGGALPMVFYSAGNAYYADASPTIYNTNTPRVQAAAAILSAPQPVATIGQAVSGSSPTIIDPSSQGQRLGNDPSTGEIDSYLLQATQEQTFNLSMIVGQGGVAAGSANIYMNGTLIGTYTIPSTPGSVSLGTVTLHPGLNSLRIETVHGVNDPSQPGSSTYYSWAPTALVLVPQGAPSVPTNVTAATAGSQLTLSWSTVPGASSYNVYRSTSPNAGSGPLTLLQSGIGGTSLVDSTAAVGTTYYYYVSAANAVLEGGISAPAMATLLPAPAGFSATPAYGQVTLNWQPVAGAAGYNIYRGTASGGETLVATAGKSAAGYVDNPLSSSTYYYYVTATNANGLGARSVEVSATPAAASAAPGAPTGLTITPQNGGAFLSWAPTPGATSYKIYRGTSSGSETYLTTTWWSGAGWYDTGLTNNSHYYYTITAVNSRGEGSPSAEVSVTPSLPPSAPTNVAAVASSGQVVVSWSGVSGATSYNVLRSVWNGPVALYASGITGTSFTDTSVSNGAPYHYYVVAFTAVGGSGWSAGVTATPTPSPATPTGLQAVPGNGLVQLSWQRAANATSYNLYRSTQSGQETLLASGLTGPFYTDQSVSNGATYYYTLKAIGPGGSSGASSEVTSTPALIAPPAAPTGLTATAGDGEVTLHWSAAPGATAYNIYRSTTAGQEQLIDAGVTGTSYVDSGYDIPTASGYSTALSLSSFLFTVDGTTYYYTVKAVNSAGEGLASREVSATPVPAIAASPTGLSTLAGDNLVVLHWNPAGEAASYDVYRGTTAGSLTLLQAGVSGLSFTDTSARDGTTYFYSVSGVNSRGEGQHASAVSVSLAIPTAAPAAPANVQVTTGDGSATLTWAAVPGAASYTLYRSSQNGSVQVVIAGLGGTGYHDSGLNYGTTYSYQVAAFNSKGTGTRSTAVTAVLPALNQVPAAPSTVTATPASGMVTLVWSSVPNATSYSIYRGTSSGNLSYYASSAQPKLIDTSVANGTSYYYSVQAVNLSGSSASSAVVSTAPQGSYAQGAPAAPTGLTVQASNGTATLTWQATPGATEYFVFRGTSSGGEAILSSVVRNLYFTDGNLNNGTTYYYYVVGVSIGAGGSPHLSAASTELSATPLAPQSVNPGPPVSPPKAPAPSPTPVVTGSSSVSSSSMVSGSSSVYQSEAESFLLEGALLSLYEYQIYQDVDLLYAAVFGLYAEMMTTYASSTNDSGAWYLASELGMFAEYYAQQSTHDFAGAVSFLSIGASCASYASTE